MIDGLKLELDRLYIGPDICDLNVPYVILDNDTSDLELTPKLHCKRNLDYVIMCPNGCLNTTL